MAANKSMSTDLVRVYLQEIGRIPLLTPDQEVLYGQQVQKWMKLIELQQKLASQLDRSPTLAEWAQQVGMSELELQRAVSLGKTAKRKLLEANLRLVVSIAKKYTKRNVELLDLIQEGTLGMDRGIEKFDPTRGYRFSTYAYWWIRQAITRAVAEKGRAIRLPVYIVEKLNLLKKTQRQLSQQLGRTATVAELATALELTPEQVREYLEWARYPASLDAGVGDDQNTELGELLEDPGIPLEEQVLRSALQEDLHRVMAALTPRQQEVLSLHFGLTDGQGISLTKIGKQLNISRERVRQIEQEALKILRQNRAGIEGYGAMG
ncbi:RpoD/SigA family RNA polymerase sigma factor [Kovacikia minuta CCNUW1]|uniref:RpoD/SigA family RNA polymerase sigma factor n=1 Tax=Kovacikia minuta TaxID=2931930 RepID=UPI001CCB4473|nr:RpoD/SigA family RNA polymerase sigma factor [Kovacikia minuta]UBF26309.1 RpoD/SigA family RNA polymerase sigma factor [Kovacikia minuta CCNUW1]